MGDEVRQQAVAVETALGIDRAGDARPVSEVICVRGPRTAGLRTATGEIRIVSGDGLVRSLRTEPNVLGADAVDRTARQLATTFGPFVRR